VNLERGILEYRRALPEDFPQIVELQNKNLASALDDLSRQDGFLSTAYSLEQFEQMNNSICVIVGVDTNAEEASQGYEAKVQAYICAITKELCMNFRYPSLLISLCDELLYKGKPLSSYRYYLSNPICIDKGFRGTGVYTEICNHLAQFTVPDYDIAIGFISSANYRHLRAVRKLNVEIVGKFVADGEEFVIIVVPTRDTLSRSAVEVNNLTSGFCC